MSFPIEAPASEPGTFRWRAEAEQAGPAVFIAPDHVVGGGSGLFESAAEPSRPGAAPHDHRGFSSHSA